MKERVNMPRTKIIIIGLGCLVLGVFIGKTDISSIVKAAGELWLSSGTNIYSTNSGGIGLGKSAPASKLHLYQNNTAIRGDAGLTIEQDGTGDAKLQYLLTGNQRWVMGIDNSDADKFKIGRGSNWAYGEYIVLETNGDICIGSCN